jgi:Tol biopolymer transport system component
MMRFHYVFLLIALLIPAGCRYTPATDPAALSKDLFFVAKNGDNFEIYGVNDDGGGLTRWQGNFRDVQKIAWAENGSALAVLGERGPDPVVIYITLRNESDKEISATVPATVTSKLVWSPHGDEIAFSAGDNQRERVYVFNIAERRIRPVSPDETRRASWPQYSPDGQWLTFQSSNYPECPEAGRCPTRLSLMNRRTGEIKQILPEVNSEAYYRRNECDVVWSPDSSALILHAGCDPGEMPYRLYRYDLASGNIRPLFQFEATRAVFGDAAVRWLPGGDVLVRSDRNGVLQLLRVKPEDGTIKTVLNWSEPFNYTGLGASSDGQQVWWTHSQLWRGDMSSGLVTSTGQPACEIDLSPTSDKIVFDKHCLPPEQRDNSLWVVGSGGEQPAKVSGSLDVPYLRGLWGWIPKQHRVP